LSAVLPVALMAAAQLSVMASTFVGSVNVTLLRTLSLPSLAFSVMVSLALSTT
jgi:hypothetical protein